MPLGSVAGETEGYPVTDRRIIFTIGGLVPKAS
jgi:hypothetical protein